MTTRPVSLRARLARAGLLDTPAALDALARLRWLDGEDMLPAVERVLHLVGGGPEPTAALLDLANLAAARPDLAWRLPRERHLASVLTAIFGTSRSLATWLVRNPDVVADLTPARLAIPYRAGHLDDIADATWEEGLAAIRRHRTKWFVHVVARDLLGFGTVEGAMAEVSELAADCLTAGLALAEIRAGGDTSPLAIVGMGKLGAEELNYRSDVDVLFVTEGPPPRAQRVAALVIAALAETTADGVAFPVDTELRPEGRSGPLARTLASYRSYYERWARTWEFQALLKARPVAGDKALGAAFTDLATPFVYPETLPADAVREVRAMKSRIEATTDAADLKRGAGGIRDVEFAVQLLQMVHGRADAELRVRATLPALERLATRDYVDPADAAALRGAYLFLRQAEHRLQLHREESTHRLPLDGPGRERLGRAMGYRDLPEGSAGAQFETALGRHRAAVRGIHEHILYRPLLEAFAQAPTRHLSRTSARERLAAFGFSETDRAERALEELQRGLTRQSQLMAQLLPLMLGWLSESPDPDLGLAQLHRLLADPVDGPALATSLRARDNPTLAERLSRLLGASRAIGDGLARVPEFVQTLGGTDLEAPKPAADLGTEVRKHVHWRVDNDQRLLALRRFRRREVLRVGARTLLGYADGTAVGTELTDVAEAVFSAGLEIVRAARPSDTFPFAVIALGRFGAGELQFASDLDVMFVFDDAPLDRAMRFGAAVRDAVGGVTAEGAAFTVDVDLRPEGRNGPLVRSLASYKAYYAQWGQTWERQALAKARLVAGDAALGAAFLADAHDVVYGRPFGAEEEREVRLMKARIERERIPANEDARYHLKLGPGGLADVEFTVELLRLRAGTNRPELRQVGTLAALAALTGAGEVGAEDAARLHEAYRLGTLIRNVLYLVEAAPRNALPADAARLGVLARALGYTDRPGTSLREDWRRATRRARVVVERLFYGRDV